MTGNRTDLVSTIAPVPSISVSAVLPTVQKHELENAPAEIGLDSAPRDPKKDQAR